MTRKSKLRSKTYSINNNGYAQNLNYPGLASMLINIRALNGCRLDKLNNKITIVQHAMIVFCPKYWTFFINWNQISGYLIEK